MQTTGNRAAYERVLVLGAVRAGEAEPSARCTRGDQKPTATFRRYGRLPEE
ncbi:hypothetical protein ABZ820_09135 [Streptomyces diacarni]|uniref:hypothetical protein n=1 Tax=Streptomyces diacarni TaxID=2800381 RepID=UPI0033F6B114